jgi:hypothetical protein
MPLSKPRKMKIESVLFPGMDSGGISRYIASEPDWKGGKMPLKYCEETVKQTGHKNIHNTQYQLGSAMVSMSRHVTICRYRKSYMIRLPPQTCHKLPQNEHL